MNARLGSAALCTTLLVLLVGAASATTVVEREFRYGAERFRVARNADGTTQVDMTRAPHDDRQGRPDLPLIGEPVEIPVGTRVARVEVAEIETAPLARDARLGSTVIPRPGLGPIERSTPDPAFFGRSDFVPGDPVTIGTQGFQRGRAMVTLAVSPVRWNPASGELERIARVRVRLVLEPAADRPLERLRVVPEWEEPGTGAATISRAALPASLAGRRPAEPFAATQVPSVLGSPVAYLIITNDAMAPVFQQLADWKTQSGVPAVVRTLSFIQQQYPRGADDAERIRAFIRDAYTRWGIKWVLLGGDTDILPARMAFSTYYTTFENGGDYIPSDLYFSCLDGSWNADGDSLYGESRVAHVDSLDLYPEVYVGRAPTSTPAAAQLFVNKTLGYEKQPVTDYMQHILFFAEVLFPPDWVPGGLAFLDGASLIESDVLPVLDSAPWVKYARLYENDTSSVWRPGALHEDRRTVIDSLNVGYNIAVHVGHGYRNVMHVGDDNLTNNDAAGLTNGNRVMNLYAIDCTSNAITFPCIGEAFLQAAGGGAVTNIGSTNYDFPNYGRYYQQEYFAVLFQDSVTAVGEAQARQKLPFLATSNWDGAQRWEQLALLLLGDPELRIYTNTPRTLAVTRPGSVSLSDSVFSVHVAVDGAALAGALVTAYKPGADLQSVLTNASGDALVPFRADSIGTFTLTVTAFNSIPYQATVTVAASGQAVLTEGHVRLDDTGAGGTIGNGNRTCDAGETVALNPVTRNTGGAAALSVTGRLSTTDTMITVLQATASYGTIAAGDTAAPASGFRIQIPPYAPDQREIPFTLRLNDAGGHSFLQRFQLTLLAPDLRHYGHVVLDLSGNGDGRPDIGETDYYYFKLRNMGTGTAPNVRLVLRKLAPDDSVALIDSTATIGTLLPGQEIQAADAVTIVPASLSPKVLMIVSDDYGELFRQKLDLQYPATPTNVGGVGAASTITLGWTMVYDKDLLGYYVYRSTSGTGTFTRITPAPTGRTALYLDEGLQGLTRYYYKVSAVDSSGNESRLSAVQSASTNPPYHSIFPVPTRSNTSAPVAVDHIYPGYSMDIVAGSDVLYVFHPDGTAPVDADGSIATPGDFTMLGKAYAAGPSVADLDGTGKVIIGGTYNDSTLYVFDQAGHLKPGWPAKLPNSIWSAAAVGDLVGNGQKEIVTGCNDANLYVFRPNGTEWMDGDANPATIGVFKTLSSTFNIGTPALAPLENDGQLAIVYGGYDGYLYALRANGENVPGFPKLLNGPVTGSVAVGALDGPSGGLSIVVNTIFDNLYVYRADGTLHPGFPQWVKTSGTSKSPSPALADMNGDGYLDIVIASTNGCVYTFDHNGGAIQPWNVRYSVKTSEASECSPIVADIDGDGHPDVLMGDEENQLAAISGADGSMLPGFPIRVQAEIRGTPAVCDCDADGKTEIVLAGWDKNVYVWDYDFPFSPGQVPPWPQFHHDAMRTGYSGTPMYTGVKDGPAAPPQALELDAPAPNPARSGARITFEVPSAKTGGSFELAMYDLNGRRVRVLGEGRAQAGRFSLAWDLRDASGRPASAGVYFARLTLGSEVRSRKLVVVH